MGKPISKDPGIAAMVFTPCNQRVKRARVWTSPPTIQSREPKRLLLSIRLQWASGRTASARSKRPSTRRRKEMRQNMRLLKPDFEVGCLLPLKRPASAGLFFLLPSYQIKRLNDDQAFDLCLSHRMK